VARQTRRKKRGDHFRSATKGGARCSLALGYYQVVSRDFSLAAFFRAVLHTFSLTSRPIPGLTAALRVLQSG
jgi:hypothetical protein